MGPGLRDGGDGVRRSGQGGRRVRGADADQVHAPDLAVVLRGDHAGEERDGVPGGGAGAEPVVRHQPADGVQGAVVRAAGRRRVRRLVRLQQAVLLRLAEQLVPPRGDRGGRLAHRARGLHQRGRPQRQRLGLHARLGQGLRTHLGRSAGARLLRYSYPELGVLAYLSVCLSVWVM